jgi:hypothetical protein
VLNSAPKPSKEDRLKALEDTVHALQTRVHGLPSPVTAPAAQPGTIKRFGFGHISGKQIALATLAVAVLAMLVGVLGIFASPYFQKYLDGKDASFNNAIDQRIDVKLKDVNSKLDKISNELSRLDGSLSAIGPFIQDLIRNQMNRSASLKKEQFNEELPQLKKVITAAQKVNLTIPDRTMSGLQRNLLNAGPNSSEYWPAVGTFITYRSSIQLSQPISHENIKRCTDSEPDPMKITAVKSPYEATASPGIYENCRFTLDSPEDDARLNGFLHNIPLIAFRHCLIEYRGGSVDLILHWNVFQGNATVGGKPIGQVSMSGNTIEFEDCLFEFLFENTPPSIGQQIAIDLLTQSGPKARLPINSKG